MATKKELREEIDRLNKKYCKNTKNKLVLGSAYGGYQVQLTGKRYKNNPRKWRGIGSGVSSMTYGFQSAKNTLNNLYEIDSKGYLRSRIKDYERPRRQKRFK